MDEEYKELLPAHIQGRNLETLKDPAKTIDQEGVNIGGYVRVSTRKESQRTSIENQKKYLKEWAEVNKYNMVRFYLDVKTGEYLHQRNDINIMLEDVKNGKIKGVVSKELSRTSRNVTDILDFKRKIVRCGGFLVLIKENYDSRTDKDEFLLTIYGALAHKEIRTTASRVKITQIIKAKEGKTNVPQPAFGYMLSADKQRLVKNPETFPFYRFMVEKFIDGWGQLKITKYLNQKGVLTRRGHKWSSSAVKVVITNPVYLGLTIYNATTLTRNEEGKQIRVIRPREDWIVRSNTHEPLLSRDEYEKIMTITQTRRDNDCKEWSCERKYLGSSLLRCSVCGGKIYGSRFKSKKQDVNYYYRYTCRGANGKCGPKMKYWKMEEVDYNIRELFKILFSNREKLFQYLQNEPGIFEDDMEDAQQERYDLISKLDQLERAIKKQQIAFENDVITIDEYRIRIEELRNEKKSMLEKLNKIDSRLKKHDSIIDKLTHMLDKVSDKIMHVHELPEAEVAEYIDAVFEKLYLAQDGSIVDVEFKL